MTVLWIKIFYIWINKTRGQSCRRREL